MAPLAVPSRVWVAFSQGSDSFINSRKEDGSVGGTAQKAGGPFDKEGAVGKQFTKGGALGSTAQSVADTAQSASKLQPEDRCSQSQL
jgi:hypothetical protein